MNIVVSKLKDTHESRRQKHKDNYGIPGEPNRVRRWGFSANL